jgi:hypothetical protein
VSVGRFSDRGVVDLKVVREWDTISLEQLEQSLSSRISTIEDVHQRLADTGRLPAWTGKSAEAARESFGVTVDDLLDEVAAITAVRQVTGETLIAVTHVKKELDALYTFADSNELAISDDGRVTDTSYPSERSAEDAAQRRAAMDDTAAAAKALILQAEDIDADAATILMRVANGEINAQGAKDAEAAVKAGEEQGGLTAPAPPINGTAAENREYWESMPEYQRREVLDQHPEWVRYLDGVRDQLDPTRAQTERDAFRETFGRNPTSETDWRTAEILNTENYDPKYKGVDSEVVVSRIEPVPGQGVVRMGLFIPSESVFNVPEDDLGDNRGFDKNFTPEHTRASVYVDYENGVVITRQNPSVQTDGEVRVDVPDTKTWQTSDGTVMVDYSAKNPFAPPGSELAGKVVSGSVIVSPHESGPSIYGDVGDYPSLEVYSDRPGEPTRTLLNDEADNTSSAGPLLELGTSHVVGDRPENFGDLFDEEPIPGNRRGVTYFVPRVDGTASGSPSDPPQTVIVGE